MAASNSAFLPGAMRMSASSRIMVGLRWVVAKRLSAAILARRAQLRSHARAGAPARRAAAPSDADVAGQHDAALLQHHRLVGVGQHGAVVAVDDQRADAAGADVADRRARSRRRSAAPGLRSPRRGSAGCGLVISARPIESICCSPPESCWPPWPAARRGAGRSPARARRSSRARPSVPARADITRFSRTERLGKMPRPSGT